MSFKKNEVRKKNSVDNPSKLGWLMSRAVLSLLCMATISSSGCGKSGSRRNRAAMTTANYSGQLVSDVLGTLNDLDASLNLEIRPHKLILDATKSSNKDDVKATLKKDAEYPEAPCIRLHVVTNNSDFTRLAIPQDTPGVKPDDLVRIYYQVEQEGEEAKTVHQDLEVGQIVDDSDLRLKQGPAQPLETPIAIEIWRRTSEKFRSINETFEKWIVTGQPAVDWEPIPDRDILHQLVERLNQAQGDTPLPKNWTADPLAEPLYAEYSTVFDPKSLSRMRFSPSEGRLLQEAVWLRNISYMASNDAATDLEKASNLFDWVIRHVQVSTRMDLHGVWHRPWQTLIHGKGTADDRAWVFVLLCRQQGLAAVVLTPIESKNEATEKGDATEKSGAKEHPSLVGVLTDQQIYLFDPLLGLSLPGPNGKGIATLANAAEDDAVLRQLDLDDAQHYPWSADDFKKMAALIESTPLSLSARAHVLDSVEQEARQLVTSVSPTEKIASRLKNHPQIAEVKLWTLPYLTLKRQAEYTPQIRIAAVTELVVFAHRPSFWKARLIDFKRASNRELAAGLAAGGEDAPAVEIEKRVRDTYMKVRTLDESSAWINRDIFGLISRDAGYWLGQIALDRGVNDVAVDYFGKRVLPFDPNHAWSAGARYGLARAHQEAGRTNLAIQWYEDHSTTGTSPQQPGNQWRAKQLKPAADEVKPEAEPKKKDDVKNDPPVTEPVK